MNGDEESEKYYNYSSAISPIQSNKIISEFTEINTQAKNLDIQPKKFFKNITNMNSMFYGCSSLISLPDISKLDIKNVTNISSMFQGCSSLISLPDISK